MPTRAELMDALLAADASGDTEVADSLFNDIESLDESASLAELIPEVATPASEKERTTSDYVKDQMSLRYGDWADMVMRAGAATMGAYPNQPAGLPEELGKIAVEDKSKEIATGYLGYQGLKPQTEEERWAGVVGAAAVDPINLYFPAKILSVGKSLLTTTKPYIIAAFEWASGTASEVAGFAGAEVVADTLKGTEYENTAIDHLARVAAGGTLAVLPSSAARTIQSGVEGYKAGQKVVQGSADTISDLFTNKAVNAVLDRAIESQGSASFTERLKAAEKLQEQFPDLVLPLVDVVGENAILAKEFRTLYSSDPVFRQKYDDATKQVKAQFDTYRETVLPATGVDDAAIRNIVLAEADKKALAARKTSETKLQNIENARQTLASKYDEAPLASNIEQAARNVSEAAEKAARQNANVYYANAFKYADDNGLTVPPSVVSDLWNYAKAQRTSDLFAEFPSLYRKIEKFWSPKEVQGSGLLTAKGTLISPKATLQFEPASIEDLDSLKRELNSAMRTTSDKAKRASLGDLKGELDSQIRAIDPKFAELYRAADAQYYEGVGLPTSLQGYRSVDSARFSTTIAEALTKPDQIKDYLNFVGRDAGIEVVRDALLMKARRKILTSTGEVDPNKLRAFVASNRDALDQVPEIRAIFNADGMLAERIHRGKAKIESTYNVYALEQSEGFFKALTNKNLDKVGTEVLSNPAARGQYLAQIQTLSIGSRKLALTGLRQTMLDKAFSAKNITVLDYIKENKAAFNDVFGAEYSEQIQSLATLRDIIATNEGNLVASGISHRQSTGFKETMGVSQEEVLGTLRNQIMSWSRKLLHLGFKATVTKNNAKADKAMADVLLDTKGLSALKAEAEALQKAMGNNGTAAVTGKAFLQAMQTFGATMAGYVTLGVVRGASGSTIDGVGSEASLLPTLEEDNRLWLFAPEASQQQQQPQQ
tara:strand:+ start:1045 stop:3867 length:2823 start_codon:yes stop_codon:yes gene_type:complete